MSKTSEFFKYDKHDGGFVAATEEEVAASIERPTLRDLFAMHANVRQHEEDSDEFLAKRAYEFADAMLKARLR